MWDEVIPIDQNGVITMYEVMYTPLEVFVEAIGTGLVNVTCPSMSVVLTDLERFTFYNISVRAYTQLGQGNFSSPITERTDKGGKVILTSLYIYLVNFSLIITNLVSI